MTKELPLGCLQTFKNLDELNSYILDRVNHETDIIMESDWFDEIIERKVKAAIEQIKFEEKMESFVRERLGEDGYNDFITGCKHTAAERRQV